MNSNNNSEISKYDRKVQLSKRQGFLVGTAILLFGFAVETVTVNLTGASDEVNPQSSDAGHDGGSSWITDWLPVSIWLVLGFAFLFAWFFWGKRSLKKLEDSTGTYYFVRAQPVNRLSMHFDRVVEDYPDVNDFRAIHRVLPNVDPNCDVFDVSGIGESILADLERSTNSDDDHSLFQLAPDLIWSMSFRLGNEWLPRGDIELRELGPTINPKTKNTSGDTSWFYRSRLDSWEVLKTEGCEISNDSPYPFFVDSYRDGSTVHTDISPILSDFKPRDSLGVSETSQPKRILLDIKFSRGNFFNELKFESRLNGEKESGIEYDLVRRCRPVIHSIWLETEEIKSASRPSLLEDDESQLSTDCLVISGNELSSMVAGIIAQTLEEFPEAIIDVVMIVPKTIAFAAGLHITHIESKTNNNLTSTDYWTRLRLLHYDMSDRRSYWAITHPIEKHYLERIKDKLAGDSREFD